MIVFECPGCTKPMEANRAFAGFDTRCLRCGTVIRIPSRGGDEVETLAKAGLPKPKAPTPRPAPVIEPMAEPEPESVAVATAAPPVPKRRSLKPESVSEPTPIVAEKAKSPRKRNKLVMAGVIVGLLAVIGIAIGSLTGKKSDKDTYAKKPEPPNPAPQKKIDDPAPKPPETPKIEPKPVVYEPAPAPRSVRPAIEYELTVAALLQEYNEGPPACDAKYDGKDLLVRGVYHQYSLGKVQIVSSDARSAGITFTLQLPTEIRNGELLPDPGLTPGQPVVLRGTYQPGCRFHGATIELTDSPAERIFGGKPVLLEGAIVRGTNPPTGAVPFPALILEPPATDSRIAVTCYFKVSDADEVMKLKPGQKVDVRGRCSGRNYTAVRLDNCTIATPEQPPGPEVIRLAASTFFNDYESDLLAAPRANPRDPMAEVLPVTAEGIGHAFQIDARSANITYRNKVVQLSGYVKERHAGTRMLVFQCGTESSFSVAAVFSPNAFDALPDEKTMVIRGVCSGFAGGYIRIDSAEYAEALGGLAAMRTDPEFLPYRFGKEHIVDQLLPARGKESPVKRLAIRFSGDDQIHVVVQKSGYVLGSTLFREALPEPRWVAATTKYPTLVRHYRIREGTVEIGQPIPMGEKREITDFWEPVLKSGLKRGQSWSAKFPDGRVATYTVTGFAKQPGTEADILDVKRVLRNPTDPTRWEETACTYIRGIGEARRIVTNRNDRNESMVISETRLVLVSDGLPAELRGESKK